MVAIHAFTVRLVDGAHKVVERIKINATHKHAALIEDQQFAPKFFLWRVQAHDNDGVRSTSICFGLMVVLNTRQRY